MEDDSGLEKEYLEFNNESEFVAWKETMERTTKSRYVQKCGPRKSAVGVVVKYFYCHRDGYFRPRGKNVRSLKSIGSNKIDGHCPSALVVRILTSGQVVVEFTKTHSGHTVDVRRLTLTKKERDAIAGKIARKIPFEDILNEIQNSVSDETRLQLLKRKDLFNIVDLYRLNKDVVYRHCDFDTVDSWVRHLKATSDVVKFYKPKGSIYESSILNRNDFCLILNSDIQLSNVDVLCIDNCRGLYVNKFDFQLYAVFVVDDNDAYPVAYMFTNRRDSQIIELYFNVLSKTSKFELTPKYFMSDVDSFYFDGWSAVYPNSQTVRLYCSWFVDAEWRSNLSKIADKVEEALVYKQLRLLMSETRIENFELMLNNFYDTVHSNTETTEFAEYIDHYVADPVPWAQCFRTDYKLLTNIRLENLHQAVEFIYLQGRKEKGLDKCIRGLVELSRDRIRGTYVVDDKNKEAKKLADISNKHKLAEEMSEDFALRVEEGTWMVQSRRGSELHTVAINDLNCSCHLRCDECSSCIHNYQCTCGDAAVKYNMCEHIHLVCRLDRAETKDVVIVEELPLDTNIVTLEGEEIVFTECPLTPSLEPVDELADKKRSLSEELLQIIDNCRNEKELEAVAGQLAVIKEAIVDIRQNTYDDDVQLDEQC